MLAIIILTGCSTQKRPLYGPKRYKTMKEWPYHKPLHQPFGHDKLMVR